MFQDLLGTFVDLLKGDSAPVEEAPPEMENLLTICGPARFNSQDFVVLRHPTADEAGENSKKADSKKFPRISYFYVPGPWIRDRKQLTLVVTSADIEYDRAVAIDARVSWILVNPKKQAGTKVPSLRSSSVKVFNITRGRPTVTFNPDSEVHRVSTPYSIIYV